MIKLFLVAREQLNKKISEEEMKEREYLSRLKEFRENQMTHTRENHFFNDITDVIILSLKLV